jgi:hypothetical protein
MMRDFNESPVIYSRRYQTGTTSVSQNALERGHADRFRSDPGDHGIAPQ